MVDLVTHGKAHAGECVLDAGCGTGNYVVALARAGFGVTGLDYAPGMLARARAKVTGDIAPRISLRRVSLNATLPFAAGSFDHAISISVLQAVADPAFTLRELRRVLKPGGTLVLTHQPRPAPGGQSLSAVITARTSSLARKTWWRAALVAAKAVAERAGATRYWTTAELEQMLRAGGYAVLSVDEGPPIVFLAQARSLASTTHTSDQ